MVRVKLAFVLAVVPLCCLVFLTPKPVFSEHEDPPAEQRITLLNHNPKADNWNDAIVSFRIERLYNRVQGPHNEWDVLYGGLSYNGSRDWLRVNCERNSWSRIRNLGEKNWSDDIQVPVLNILPCLNERCGRIHVPPPRSGNNIDDENLNPHLVKAKAGHMYVVHRFREKRKPDENVFQNRSDYYTLIRVEELKPNQSCTISWKRVATPEQ